MQENLYRRNIFQKTKYKLHEMLNLEVKTKNINKYQGKLILQRSLISFIIRTEKIILGRCVKYINILFFSGQFFLYKDRIEGCSSNSVDSVLIQRKRDKRKFCLLAFLCSDLVSFSVHVLQLLQQQSLL